MKTSSPVLLAALLAEAALSRQIPQNVRNLYDSIRVQKACNNELRGGFYSQEQDSKSMLLLCQSQWLYIFLLTTGTTSS